MTFREAAIKVIQEADRPLSTLEVARAVLDRGLVTTKGWTPEATVNTVLINLAKDPTNPGVRRLAEQGQQRAKRGTVRWVWDPASSAANDAIPALSPAAAPAEVGVAPDSQGGRVVRADNLTVLATLEDASVDLIYVDPPFNTGKRQSLQRIKTVRDANGDRTGFQGKRYRTLKMGSVSYTDWFDDYLAFLEPRLIQFHRVLKRTGTLYFHVDYREVHYCKVLLDAIFGRECFLNEVIWAYVYGARTTKKWPTKHDNILVYVKDPDRYFFDADAVERIPYMAPGLVGPEKAARGKLPTDTWWHTIVPPAGRERTGYPNQKPLGIVRRIVQASCPEGGLVADFFAGSGTAGAAAYEFGRRFLMVDENPEAIRVMRTRFAGFADVTFEGVPEETPSTAQHPITLWGTP